MVEEVNQVLFTFLVLLLFSVSYTEQLQSSQKQTLFRIQSLLNYPSFLATWKNNTDFCNSDPTPTLTVVCYENSITQLHIIGENESPRLPNNFSIDSFFTTLTKLPRLKVLRLVSLGLWGQLLSNFTSLSSLEIVNFSSNFLEGEIPSRISSLTQLQTLILDSNNFTGRLPEGVGSLSSLAVLSLKNNALYGNLPHTFGSLINLRILVLSNNNFSGEVPDLSSLTNLQILDLENNVLGSRFPVVGNKIERILIRNNRFTYGIPDTVKSYYQLKLFDISSNKYIGPFPVSILSLPSITFLDISQNKFTGMFFENLPCNEELEFVNFTSNLLTGKLPSCLLSGSRKRVVLYSQNCLETGDSNQQPVSFCKNQALAVGNLPNSQKRKETSNVILALSICGGFIVTILLVTALFFIIKNFLSKKAEQEQPQPQSVPNSYTSKLLKDARYITQAMKIGALGLPPYRTFSLEELEEATNNFDTSSFMGEGSHGQMYRGRLRDGSYVAIRCLKLKRNHSTQYFMPHIEMISKLRHHHLVSSLGNCFEYYLEDSSVSRVFLVFEYVPNGTLRNWTSEKSGQRYLTWAQRIAATTGVAKGIQFLHTGIVPGLFSNNLKINDVLMDQNLSAKISSYNLPLLAENIGKEHLRSYKTTRGKNQDKSDIYDFGVILLEVISGKVINSRNEIEVLKHELQAVDDISRTSVIDPVLNNTCSGESLKTMMEICCRCLVKDPNERPSIEDVLWNLQFAAQVQDSWRSDSQSSESSPISALPSSRLKLTIK